MHRGVTGLLEQVLAAEEPTCSLGNNVSTESMIDRIFVPANHIIIETLDSYKASDKSMKIVPARYFTWEGALDMIMRHGSGFADTTKAAVDAYQGWSMEPASMNSCY